MQCIDYPSRNMYKKVVEGLLVSEMMNQKYFEEYSLENQQKVSVFSELRIRLSVLHHFWNLSTVSLLILAYLLTPWSRVLLEKLTASAASQEIPRIFGTRSFIIVLTSARHLSPS